MHFGRSTHCHDDPQLTPVGFPIPVVEQTKFPGLIFGQRLTFKPHILQLKVNCLWALDLLKILSHSDWGADKATLLMCIMPLFNQNLIMTAWSTWSTCLTTVCQVLPWQTKNWPHSINQSIAICIYYFEFQPSVHVLPSNYPLMRELPVVTSRLWITHTSRWYCAMITSEQHSLVVAFGLNCLCNRPSSHSIWHAYPFSCKKPFYQSVSSATFLMDIIQLPRWHHSLWHHSLVVQAIEYHCLPVLHGDVLSMETTSKLLSIRKDWKNRLNGCVFCHPSVVFMTLFI